MKITYCRVITEYRTHFLDPLKLRKNEMVQTEKKESEWQGWIWCITKNGKEGWVPKNYLEIQGKSARLLLDYDATELNVDVGEKLEIEKEESGWIWVTNEKNKQGWIPLENVEVVDH
ncbi:MAG: SH3 domain-containing protein [Promethearchaeota archaeon]